MAWVRRVRTASGATAVQIAESVAGRRRIVRHVGSARDEAELGLLIEEANRLLADDQQGILDLGITPALPKATMALPSTPAGLFASTAATPPSRQLANSDSMAGPPTGSREANGHDAGVVGIR